MHQGSAIDEELGHIYRSQLLEGIYIPNPLDR